MQTGEAAQLCVFMLGLGTFTLVYLCMCFRLHTCQYERVRKSSLSAGTEPLASSQSPVTAQYPPLDPPPFNSNNIHIFSQMTCWAPISRNWRPRQILSSKLSLWDKAQSTQDAHAKANGTY